MQLIMGMCVQCACVRLHLLIFHLHDDINFLCQMIMITNCFHFEIHFFSILAASVEFNTLRDTERKTHKMAHLNSTQKLDAHIQFRLIASREMWEVRKYLLKKYTLFRQFLRCYVQIIFHMWSICKKQFSRLCLWTSLCWMLMITVRYVMLCFSVLLKNDERNTNEMFCNFPPPFPSVS